MLKPRVSVVNPIILFAYVSYNNTSRASPEKFMKNIRIGFQTIQDQPTSFSLSPRNSYSHASVCVFSSYAFFRMKIVYSSWASEDLISLGIHSTTSNARCPNVANPEQQPSIGNIINLHGKFVYDLPISLDSIYVISYFHILIDFFMIFSRLEGSKFLFRFKSHPCLFYFEKFDASNFIAFMSNFLLRLGSYDRLNKWIFVFGG